MPILCSRGVRENVPHDELLTEMGWCVALLLPNTNPSIDTEGHWTAPDQTILSFDEVRKYLEKKGWHLQDVPEEPKRLAWSRGAKPTHGQFIEHHSKCGRAKIVKEFDTHVPCYVLYLSKKPANFKWVPVTPPRHKTRRSDDQYKGWWRLKDAKQAAGIVFANPNYTDDDLPKTGKKPSLPNYGTYDPAVEGYGSPDQWKATLNARLGIEESNQILGGRLPIMVLAHHAGVSLATGDSWDTIKSAYRKAISKWHPDKHHNDDKKQAEAITLEIRAAYELLEEQYK